MKTKTRLPRNFTKFASQFDNAWQIQIPRTGSTYANQALHWAGVIDLGHHTNPMLGHDHCCEGELRFINGSAQDKPGFKDSFRFSIIRNPYSHLVSLYEYEKKTNKHNRFFHCDVSKVTFKEFLKMSVDDTSGMFDWCAIRIMQNFLTAQTFDEDGNSQIHALVRHEFLDDGLEAILSSVNIELPGLYEQGFSLKGMRVNDSTPHSDSYLRYYDDEMIEMVQKGWGRELEIYGYDLNGPTDNYCILNPQIVNYSPIADTLSTNKKISLHSPLKLPVVKQPEPPWWNDEPATPQEPDFEELDSDKEVEEEPAVIPALRL